MAERYGYVAFYQNQFLADREAPGNRALEINALPCIQIYGSQVETRMKDIRAGIDT